MKTKIKKIIGAVTISAFSLSLVPINLETTNANVNIVYPLKKISKLECRFNEFQTLNSDCIEDLPILKTADYKKYASQNGGYNKYTRLYTVLWGASYKYGWDVGYGGHMGVDIATAKGTPVYSIADGEVINAKFSSAEGNFVSIKHTINGKTIVSNYMHLNNYSVSKGQKVKAGQQIGTVGSTGNSTGNHLHLQIDTLTTYSPIYYNRNTCPYSYYEITEKGHCFDELERITVDPLLFLETNGAILNNNVSTTKVSNITNTSTNNSQKTSTNTTKTTTNTITVKANSSIFDKNVFIGSPFGDVREVQMIYKSLGYYKGEITGDYNDVLESVIKYQLDKKIITKRGDAGTGNFGPKTRAQTKADYNAYIKAGGKISTTYITGNTNNNNTQIIAKNEENSITIASDDRVSTTGFPKTEKISRDNLKTREEIETQEVEDFLRNYNINLEFQKAGGNIGIGDTEILNLTITDKRGKYFKGSMPGAMSFITNTETLSIFPEKLFFFTDGKREIKLSGLKEGTTTLYVKVGNVTVKTFTINVYNGKKTITPDNALLFGQASYLGNIQTGLGVVKDGNKNLINLAYGGNYTLKANDGNLVCLKKGNISDLKNLYRPTCNDDEFKNEINFSYNDTVGGVLIFDYKAITKNIKFELLDSKGKTLGSQSLAVSNPKGLDNYTYSTEILNSIEKGIATTGFVRGYFMQDQGISEKEGATWIKNALNNIETKNSTIKNQISSRLKEIENFEKNASNTKMLERGELLTMVNKYLVFDKNTSVSITYNDLNAEQNLLANSAFNKNETWKEENGNLFFRPKNTITRGETAYFIMQTLKNSNKNNITLK